MPYAIRKYKDGYYVIKPNEKINGRYVKKNKEPYKTRKEALPYLKALYANEPELKGKGKDNTIKEAVKKLNDGMSKEEVKETELTPLDDSEIRSYLPDNAQIVKYVDLKNYNTIDDLLPDNNPYCVLLYPNENNNNGHWVALMKYDDIIENFCSYGSKIDSQLKWHSKDKLKGLGIDRPYLSDMLNKCPYDVIYNHIKYQDEDKSKPDLATCGRHAVYRLINCIGDELNLKEYFDKMKSIKNASGESYDAIVSRLINE